MVSTAPIDTMVEFCARVPATPDELEWLKKAVTQKRYKSRARYDTIFDNESATFYSRPSADDVNAPYELAKLLKRFLFTFRKDQSLAFTYSVTPVDYIPDSFFGGAYFITGWRIYGMTTTEWLSKRKKKWQAMHQR